MRKTLASAGALLSVGALALTGCTPNNQNVASSASGAASSDGTINVTASDDACKLSATTAKAGTVTFKVKNEGTKVNEFYVLGADGLRIVSEVENIGPNLSRDLTVELPEGSYKTACKPGMVGDGIRGDFTVTKNENATPISADEQALRDTAVTQYTAYVKDQVESLKTKTEQFAELYTAGKDDEAKALYSSARLHYERIEPVAESFGGGELDPALDAREADVEEGKEWTGWHKIEKDLWQPTAENNGGKADTPRRSPRNWWKTPRSSTTRCTLPTSSWRHSRFLTARRNCWTKSSTPRSAVRKRPGRTPTSPISRAMLTAPAWPTRAFCRF